MKKILKIICLCLVLCTLCTAFAACTGGDEKPEVTGTQQPDATTDGETTQKLDPNRKTFSTNGMSVSLTKDFKEETVAGYTATLVDNKNSLAVFILQEKFSAMEGFEDWTITEYAEAVRKSAPVSAGAVKKENDITCFEYQFTNTELNTKYYYYTTVFKDTDCFWTVQFTCLAKDMDEMKPIFAEYAQTVAFS